MEAKDKILFDQYKKELAEKNGYKVIEIFSDEKDKFNIKDIINILGF